MMLARKKVSLEDLKSRIAQLEGARTAHSALIEGARTAHSDLIEGVFSKALKFSIPQGALVEISGLLRTEWIVDFLAEHPKKKVAWAEEQFSIFPTALAQRKVNLDQIIFFEAKDEMNWVATTILRRPIFDFLIISSENKKHDLAFERRMRRYQLLAEKAKTTTFFLSDQASSVWCFSLQIEAAKKVRVLKKKI